MYLDFLHGVHIVCFKDDITIITTGETAGFLEKAMNDSLNMVAGWMDAHGLTITNSKSAALIFTTKSGFVKPTFEFNGNQKDKIRYIGVQLSSILGFKHIKVASDKSARTASALAWLMPNISGPMFP